MKKKQQQMEIGNYVWLFLLELVCVVLTAGYSAFDTDDNMSQRTFMLFSVLPIIMVCSKALIASGNTENARFFRYSLWGGHNLCRILICARLFIAISSCSEYIHSDLRPVDDKHLLLHIIGLGTIIAQFWVATTLPISTAKFVESLQQLVDGVCWDDDTGKIRFQDRSVDSGSSLTADHCIRAHYSTYSGMLIYIYLYFYAQYFSLSGAYINQIERAMIMQIALVLFVSFVLKHRSEDVESKFRNNFHLSVFLILGSIIPYVITIRAYIAHRPPNTPKDYPALTWSIYGLFSALACQLYCAFWIRAGYDAQSQDEYVRILQARKERLQWSRKHETKNRIKTPCCSDGLNLQPIWTFFHGIVLFYNLHAGPIYSTDTR